MLTELCRLGADAELKYTPNGDAVAELSLAYEVRVKGDNKTQWIKASLWGKRAESTAQHLTKGKLLFVTMESPMIREYTKADQSTGFSLVSRIIDFKFAGGQSDQRPAPAQSAPQQDYRGHSGSNQPHPPSTPQQQPAGFDSFDDDIPF